VKFRHSDVVILVHNIPMYGLKAGARGNVVEIYPGRGLEVEFERGDGKPAALLSVRERDVRKPDELPAVGRLAQAL
jgi:hypothetical protein